MGYGLTVATLLVVWKGLASMMSSAVLPPPETAVAAFIAALGQARFWMHFLASTLRSVAAMAAAWAVGFPLGLLLGGSERARALLSPFVVLTYPIPKIVLLPVLLLLFGLGDVSKVVMIALILGYQVLVTTMDGARGVHPKYLDSVRSLGAGRMRLYLEVLGPAALPHGFTALRLNAGVSVAVLFFVESFATDTGLGYMIMDAWGRMAFADMFTGIFGMSLLGVALYEAVNWLERWLCPWRRQRGR